MRAVVYENKADVRVQEVEDARIEQPTDVVVRITSTGICGSDLHMYEGRTQMRRGRCSATRTWASSPRSGPR
jgi:threonine dehydrogenase-like Zn-dependent dehydrogenase